MIRVVLPAPLRAIARIDGEVQVAVEGPATIASVLDDVERQFPTLKGTVRDHGTLRRRAFVRYFACSTDLSHDPPDTPLPDDVVTGREPLLIVGATAGG